MHIAHLPREFNPNRRGGKGDILLFVMCVQRATVLGPERAAGYRARTRHSELAFRLEAGPTRTRKEYYIPFSLEPMT